MYIKYINTIVKLPVLLEQYIDLNDEEIKYDNIKTKLYYNNYNCGRRFTNSTHEYYGSHINVRVVCR